MKVFFLVNLNSQLPRIYHLFFAHNLLFRYIMTRCREITQIREKESPRKKKKGTSSMPQVREQELTLPLANEMLQFTSFAHLACFERLQEKPFLANRFINWPILEQVGLVNEMRQLTSFGSWDTLFAIWEPVYQKHTLEFLTTFSLEERHINKSLPNTI